MKKKLLHYLLGGILLLGSISLSSQAQSITVSGRCFNSPITLNLTTPVEGKPAYIGTGTVSGTPNIQVTITWSADNNAWFLKISGGTVYFRSTGNTSLPPSNTSQIWTDVTASCPGATLSISGSGTQSLGPTIRYVDDARPDNNGDGLSWATALKDLKLAISIAQAGDEIWVAQGTYKPTTDPAQTAASFSMKEGVAIYGGFTSGQANRNDRNPDPATNNTTLSGDINNDGLPTGNSRNVVYNNFALTTAAILDGFTITHGNSNAAYGGGMYNENSSPKIANCRFIGNSAQTGGGVYNISTTGNACSPTLVNCTFQNNSASFGGGMYNNARTGTSSPTLTNCAFITNTSASGGGAMYNDASSNMGGNSSPVLTNCRFSGNATTGTNTFGGAVYNIVNAANGTSDPVFINCSFQGNTSTGFGAAVFNFGGQSGVSSPTFTNCSFQGNSSSSNNGTLVNYSIAGSRSVPLINCVFFDNGGSNTIRNLVGGTATASYSLFESSVTGYLDGGSNQTTSVNPFVSTTSTELRPGSPAIDAGNNAANSTCTDLAGNVRKLNTIDLGAYEFGAALPYSATLSGMATIPAGGTANLAVALGGGAAPYTVTYVPNGDSNTPVSGYTSGANIPVSPNATTTYRLVSVTDASGCAATLAGTPPGGSATVTVQTGPQTRYVNASRPDDSGDGLSWATAYKYLQTALTAAQSGHQIWVAQGTYKPTTSTTDRGASFVMKENVKIYGGFTSGQTNLSDRNTDPATNGTVLSGDINNDNALAGNSYNIIFNDNNGLTAAAVLDGFTITGGNADKFDRPNGGGMYNYRSAPTLINCSFQNNSANSDGGGIYNEGNNPTLINCTFQDNMATYGGGMSNYISAPILTNCSFQNNSAIKNGGGMYNEVNDPTLTNCTFQGNMAADGGGMHNDLTDPVLTNCSFQGNTATIYGGGMSNYGSSPVLTNCSFQGNTATVEGGVLYNHITSRPTLTNCVLFGNGGQNTLVNEPNSTTTATYTAFEATETDYTGSNNLTITVNPFVSNESTELSPCSPAIDAGNDAANNTTTDLAGNSRKIRTIDMGAFEYQGTLPVITATLGGGGSICGISSASLSVNITGGTGPYTLVYATNGGAQSTLTDYVSNSAIQVSPIQTTTYSLVSVTDVNGCNASTLSGNVNVTVTPSPTATVSGGGTACEGATAPSVIITLTGGAPYSLTYSDGTNSTTVDNIDNDFYYINSPAAGTYTVTAVSNASCTGTASGSASVTIKPRPDAPTISASPGNTTTNQPIVVTASGCESGTISWMISGGTGVAEGNQYTLSQPGNYTIGAKCSVNGCLSNFSNTLYPVINSCPAISAAFNGTTAICNGANTDLSVSLTGGTAPYTVAYADGSGNHTLSSYVSGTSFTVSPATTTTYTLVSVTDANGCTATLAAGTQSATVTVNPVPDAPTLSANPGTTTTNQPITVSASGCAGTLSWNTTGGTDNNDGTYTFPAAGSYSISATCTVGGCVSPASQTLNLTINSCALTLNAPSVTNLSCFESGDGAIALTATGGSGSLTYTLSPGNVQNTSGSFSGLSAGGYTVSVTDANNCTATSASIQVTQPEAVPAPTLSANPGTTTTNQPITVSAAGCAGTLSWNTTGGTDNNDGTYTFTDAGSYSISATCTVDGCTSPASQALNLTINACALALGQPTVTNLTCFESGDGAIALTATGGAGSLTYMLSPGSGQNATGSFSGLSAGSYTVSVTDANNCTATSASIQVTQPAAVPAPTLSANPGSTTTNQPITVSAAGCENGTVSWNTSGGTDNNDGTYTFTDAGSYSISATCTVGGCVSPASQTLNLTINSCALTLNAPSVTNLTCFESGNGAIAITATGATGTTTYTLSPGNVQNTSGTFSGLSAGTYTVSVTDANSCTATSGSIAVTQPAAVPAPTLSANPGTTTTNQPITVSASGCAGTLSWNTSGGTDNNDGTYTFSSVGNYTISATCTVGGCVSPASQTLNLTINSCALTLNAPSVTNLSCFESGDGTIALTATGGSGSLTYTLSPGNVQNATGSFSGLSAGSYTVSVTDANSCTATSGAISLTQPAAVPAPTLSANPGTTTTNQPITVSASGCAGTLSWNTTGGTDNNDGTYTFSAVGNYTISATCTVGGCVSPASQTLNLTINSCALTLNAPSVTNLSCFESGDGAIALTATGGSGSLTYTLSPGNVQNATGSFSGLSAGSYTVSVSNANSCTATSGSIAVTQPAAVPAPTLSANPGNTTTNQPITVSASGCAGTLSWNTTGGTDNNDGTYTFSAAGSYSISATCTVGGCVSPASQTLNLTINSCALTLNAPSVTNLSCFESGDGAIALAATGGSGSLTYTLSPGNVQNTSGTFSGLSAGTYTVSVTDANQCSATSGSIAVTQPAAVPAPTLSANPGNTTTNQPITVTASGCAGTVSWNTSGGTDNGNGTYTFTNPGSYSVSATCTVGGCVSPASEAMILTINECPTITLNIDSQTDVACFGASTGSFTVTATGGSAPYAYSIGGQSQGNGTFTGLPAGTYSVIVTDANGCTGGTSVDLSQPATALSVQASGNTSVIYGYGSSCTTLTANAWGGTPGYTYDWDNGTQGPTLNVCPTQTTTYTVTVTDAAGCTASQQVTVTVIDVRCGYGGVKMCQGGREVCVAQYLVATYLRFGYQLGSCGAGNTRQAADESAEPALSLTLTAYPNPTTGQVTVRVRSTAAGAATFELLNAQGRTVQTQPQQLTQGLNELPIDLGAQPAGNYLIRCIDAMGRQAVVRVHKE